MLCLSAWVALATAGQLSEPAAVQLGTCRLQNDARKYLAEVDHGVAIDCDVALSRDNYSFFRLEGRSSQDWAGGYLLLVPGEITGANAAAPYQMTSIVTDRSTGDGETKFRIQKRTRDGAYVGAMAEYSEEAGWHMYNSVAVHGALSATRFVCENGIDFPTTAITTDVSAASAWSNPSATFGSVSGSMHTDGGLGSVTADLGAGNSFVAYQFSSHAYGSGYDAGGLGDVVPTQPQRYQIHGSYTAEADTWFLLFDSSVDKPNCDKHASDTGHVAGTWWCAFKFPANYRYYRLTKVSGGAGPNQQPIRFRGRC
jgi:hypothetical protein